MCKVIPLTQGKETIVDDEDYEILSRYKWRAFAGNHYKRVFYAVRYLREKAKDRTIRMHREILNVPDGFYTDHIDGDGLNNRRSNLRICTVSQNGLNRRSHCKNRSGYKGVDHQRWWKQMRWRARIQINGKRIHLGHYKTKEEAAAAYDHAARTLGGGFGRPNGLANIVAAVERRG
jgi:hypothetical protein